MVQAQTSPALRYIRKLIGEYGLQHITDAQLLRRFITDRDEDAFAALMDRHGQLVFRVCRQVLHHEQDAEDAFQATFLVLARHAASIRQTEAVSSWLYRVAYRVATKAGAHMAKRRAKEKKAETRAHLGPDADLAWRELQEVFRQELNGLPEKYRAVFVLCCLEGKSASEAARHLGWKEGTVSGRLAEARKGLQQRLSRRGVTFSAILCGLALSQSVTANVSAAAVQSTVKAAQWFAQGKGVDSGAVSAKVAALAQGVTKAMFVAKLRIATLFLLAVGWIGITTGMVYQAVLGQESQSQQQEKETAVTKGGARNPRLANTPQAALPKSDKEKVQGLWRVVSVEFNGQEVTKDLGEMKWAFKGEQMTYSLKFLPDDIRITFKLESKENPKSVDFILKSASQAETMKGIYELKDDELKVCIHVQAARAQERPAEFKTKSDSNLCLFVLKREKDHTNQVPNKEERQATGKSPDSTKAAAKAPDKANGIIYLVNEELMIVPPDGKDVTRLPTKAKRMFWLQVSPNGKQLAYTAVVNGKFKGYVTDLFSEPSLISKVARLADIPEGDSLDGEVDYCRWSADGKKLACFEGLGMQGFPRGKAATTWIVDIKTGEKADFNLPNGHFLQDWSPDGNWFLTFKQDKSTENEFIPRVYLVKRDSSEVRRLSSDNQLAWSARFSPDGRRALFVSLGRQSQVHVVDLADGKPRPVSPELNAVVHSACWSPDGKRIAYAWQQRRVNPEDDQTEYVLSVIDQDGKNPATLRTDKGRDGPPVHVDWR